jgi:hypothetical protein
MMRNAITEVRTILSTRPGDSESQSGRSATAAREPTVIFSFPDDHRIMHLVLNREVRDLLHRNLALYLRK